MKLTDALRQAIRQSGQSQDTICKATGIDNASLSRFLRGKTGLLQSALDRLVEYLDLELVPRKKRRRRR